MDSAMSSLGFCNGFTWTLRVFHLEFCMDFARCSLVYCNEFILGFCKNFTWSSARILQGVHLDVAVVLLAFCRDFPGSPARILQGVHLEFCRNCAMSSLGFCTGFTAFCKYSTWSSAGILQGVQLGVARISLGVLRGFCKEFNWSSAGISVIRFTEGCGPACLLLYYYYMSMACPLLCLVSVRYMCVA